tara:strand:+ start:601 stop:822 length:222 start_codon:yes stop_codon:yes gene_type:complete
MTLIEAVASVGIFVLMVSGVAFWVCLVTILLAMNKEKPDVRKVIVEPFEGYRPQTKFARKMGEGRKWGGGWDA